MIMEKKPAELNYDALIRAKQVLDRYMLSLNTDQEKSGAIQAFEFCFELSWKTLKKVLAFKRLQVANPRDTFREAAANYYIIDLELWFIFIEYRNLTSHAYNQDIVDSIMLILPQFQKSLEDLINHLP